ncbi:MAG: glycosyltransferase family 2 protein [Candidatus Odinarchaeum yellowstonii]|uniref:Glycosyltransferase family 2 protein n=1 Tax=Odinarchaeota yellowstonii (strain LCB_4) TaxID=1841599 RepID=A0AAF0IB97_ODILC|nr:MAG: glycosyltransferase family 2 protein [Candidatus Odinarchaeum yellowstonii]
MSLIFYLTGLGEFAWLPAYYLITGFIFICNLVFAFLSNPYIYPVLYVITYISALTAVGTFIATLVWYARVRKKFSSPIKKQGVSSLSLIIVMVVLIGLLQVAMSILQQELMYTISFYLFLVSIIFLGVRTVVNISTSLAYRSQVKAETSQPLVSIIVPAFNEGRIIQETVSSLVELTYPNKEIIVVDDGSTDDTYRLAVEAGRGGNVKIISKPNGGKWSALNKGVEAAQGEIIVCIDADTKLAKDAIEYLVKHFSDSTVGAVAGNVKVGNRDRLITKLQALEYVTSINLQRRGEGYLNKLTVVPGPLGAFRKNVLLKVGLYSPDTFAEDADLTLSILKVGYKIKYEPKALGYTEAPHSFKDLAKQRYRWYRGLLQAMKKHKDMLFKSRYGSAGLFLVPWMFFNGIVFSWFTFITLIWLFILMFNPLSGFVIYRPAPRGPSKEPPRGPPSEVPGGGGGHGHGLTVAPSVGAVPQLVVEVNFFQAIPVIYIFWFFIFMILEIIIALYAVKIDGHEKKKLIAYTVLYKLFYGYFIETIRLLSQLEEELKYPMKWETVKRK